MLLSLSFEEYDGWAESVARFEPGDDILRGQVPGVHEMKNRGTAWSEVLEAIAGNYYNRNDPGPDAGKSWPGCIAHFICC